MEAGPEEKRKETSPLWFAVTAEALRRKERVAYTPPLKEAKAKGKAMRRERLVPSPLWLEVTGRVLAKGPLKGGGMERYHLPSSPLRREG